MAQLTVDGTLLERLQEEAGKHTQILGEVNLSLDGLKQFQVKQESRLAQLERAAVTPARLAVMGPTAGTDGASAGYRTSLHDIFKVVGEKRLGKTGWSQAGVREEWQDTFRKDPVAWQRDVIEKARERAMKLGAQVSGRAANMSAGILTQGGAWIPDEWSEEIIPALTAKEVVMQAGAGDFRVPAGVGTFKFPREDGRSTAYWIGEGVAPTTSGLTTGTVDAQQHQCAILVKATNSLLRMGIPSTEAYLRRALARDLGLALDLAALRGTGGSNEPVGINTLTGVGSVAVGTNGGAITYALLRNLVRTVLKANPPGERFGFIMTPSLWTEIMKLVDSQQRPLFHSPSFAPGLPGATPQTLFGYPVYLTTQIPITLTKNASGATLTEVYFGDWSEIERVMWTDMEIRLSNQAGDGTDNAFPQDLTFFLAIVSVDWVARHAASFALIADATAES